MFSDSQALSLVAACGALRPSPSAAVDEVYELFEVLKVSQDYISRSAPTGSLVMERTHNDPFHEERCSLYSLVDRHVKQITHNSSSSGSNKTSAALGGAESVKSIPSPSETPLPAYLVSTELVDRGGREPAADTAPRTAPDHLLSDLRRHWRTCPVQRRLRQFADHYFFTRSMDEKTFSSRLPLGGWQVLRFTTSSKSSLRTLSHQKEAKGDAVEEMHVLVWSWVHHRAAKLFHRHQERLLRARLLLGFPEVLHVLAAEHYVIGGQHVSFFELPKMSILPSGIFEVRATRASVESSEDPTRSLLRDAIAMLGACDLDVSVGVETCFGRIVLVPTAQSVCRAAAVQPLVPAAAQKQNPLELVTPAWYFRVPSVASRAATDAAGATLRYRILGLVEALVKMSVDRVRIMSQPPTFVRDLFHAHGVRMLFLRLVRRLLVVELERVGCGFLAVAHRLTTEIVARALKHMAHADAERHRVLPPNAWSSGGGRSARVPLPEGIALTCRGRGDGDTDTVHESLLVGGVVNPSAAGVLDCTKHDARLPTALNKLVSAFLSQTSFVTGALWSCICERFPVQELFSYSTSLPFKRAKDDVFSLNATAATDTRVAFLLGREVDGNVSAASPGAALPTGGSMRSASGDDLIRRFNETMEVDVMPASDPLARTLSPSDSPEQQQQQQLGDTAHFPVDSQRLSSTFPTIARTSNDGQERGEARQHHQRRSVEDPLFQLPTQESCDEFDFAKVSLGDLLTHLSHALGVSFSASTRRFDSSLNVVVDVPTAPPLRSQEPQPSSQKAPNIQLLSDLGEKQAATEEDEGCDEASVYDATGGNTAGWLQVQRELVEVDYYLQLLSRGADSPREAVAKSRWEHHDAVLAEEARAPLYVIRGSLRLLASRSAADVRRKALEIVSKRDALFRTSSWPGLVFRNIGTPRANYVFGMVDALQESTCSFWLRVPIGDSASSFSVSALEHDNGSRQVGSSSGHRRVVLPSFLHLLLEMALLFPWLRSLVSEEVQLASSAGAPSSSSSTSSRHPSALGLERLWPILILAARCLPVCAPRESELVDLSLLRIDQLQRFSLLLAQEIVGGGITERFQSNGVELQSTPPIGLRCFLLSADTAAAWLDRFLWASDAMVSKALLYSSGQPAAKRASSSMLLVVELLSALLQYLRAAGVPASDVSAVQVIAVMLRCGGGLFHDGHRKDLVGALLWEQLSAVSREGVRFAVTHVAVLATGYETVASPRVGTQAAVEEGTTDPKEQPQPRNGNAEDSPEPTTPNAGSLDELASAAECHLDDVPEVLRLMALVATVVYLPLLLEDASVNPLSEWLHNELWSIACDQKSSTRSPRQGTARAHLTDIASPGSPAAANVAPSPLATLTSVVHRFADVWNVLLGHEVHLRSVKDATATYLLRRESREKLSLFPASAAVPANALKKAQREALDARLSADPTVQAVRFVLRHLQRSKKAVSLLSDVVEAKYPLHRRLRDARKVPAEVMETLVGGPSAALQRKGSVTILRRVQNSFGPTPGASSSSEPQAPLELVVQKPNGASQSVAVLPGRSSFSETPTGELAGPPNATVDLNDTARLAPTPGHTKLRGASIFASGELGASATRENRSQSLRQQKALQEVNAAAMQRAENLRAERERALAEQKRLNREDRLIAKFRQQHGDEVETVRRRIAAGGIVADSSVHGARRSVSVPLPMSSSPADVRRTAQEWLEHQEQRSPPARGGDARRDVKALSISESDKRAPKRLASLSPTSPL